MVNFTRRVLVIEDDAETAEQPAQSLRASGYDVDLARDGEDGVRFALQSVDDMKDESAERLRSICDELLRIESKDFWEVIDRGTDQVGDGQRVPVLLGRAAGLERPPVLLRGQIRRELVAAAAGRQSLPHPGHRRVSDGRNQRVEGVSGDR